MVLICINRLYRPAAKVMFIKVFESWKFFSCKLLHPVSPLFLSVYQCRFIPVIHSQMRFFKLFGVFVINVIV